MPTHINTRYEEIEELMPHMQRAQDLAEQYGIRDITQDGGFKQLQITIATGIDLSGKRSGPDGFDRIGNQYEVKTADISHKSVTGFATANRLKHSTLERFRQSRWIFAVYDKLSLLEIYRLVPAQLEHIFQSFEDRLKDEESLNNPKIPLNFVRRVGAAMYLKNVAPKWAFSEAA